MARKGLRLFPRVSVIVPVFNEERNIRDCLSKLRAQTYPRERVEILVVDGMSTDSTRDVVREIQSCPNLGKESSEDQNGDSPFLQLVDNPNRQRSSALNIGIRRAKGDVIIRIDARTVAAENYLEKCVRTLIETGADNVGGVQKPLPDTQLSANCGRRALTAQAIGIAMSHPFGVGNAHFRLGRKSGYVDSVYLGCFRRGVFDKIGLFDEESPIITEDSDINYRIRKAGGKVYLNKDIIAYYRSRDSFKEFRSQYFFYGELRAGYFFKHKTLALRQLALSGFVVTLGILPLLSFFSWSFLPILALNVLVGLYLLGNISISVMESMRSRNIALLPFLILAFGCVHSAWGLGFLYRLIRPPKPGQHWKH